MKKLITSILALLLSLLCISNVFAKSAEWYSDSSAPSARNNNTYTIKFGSESLTVDSYATPYTIQKEVKLQLGTFVEDNSDSLEYLVNEEANEKAKKANEKFYSLTIAVEQPNPGTYDCASYGGGKKANISLVFIGHTFVLLGEHEKNQPSIFSAKGFYPANKVGYHAALNNTGVDAAIMDDQGHNFNIRKTYWVDKKTYDKAKKYIESVEQGIKDNTRKYKLVTYNCTTFAKYVMNAAIIKTGVKTHNWIIPNTIKETFSSYKDALDKFEKNIGYYPGAAGEQLRGN